MGALLVSHLVFSAALGAWTGPLRIRHLTPIRQNFPCEMEEGR